jgi:hypothetical protein
MPISKNFLRVLVLFFPPHMFMPGYFFLLIWLNQLNRRMILSPFYILVAFWMSWFYECMWTVGNDRFSLYHRAFLFTIFICSNKCTFFNITPIQCQLLKHLNNLKTPTCFDHTLIILPHSHDYHMKILSDFNKVQVTPWGWSVYDRNM